jgi:hypothetical protein
MTALGTASVLSPASPDAFFARWADMATWPQWNADTEWVRLDGPFVPGATGTLKPKGGPKVRFTVASLVPGGEFVDVSHLFGARLTFAHTVTVTGAGTRVDVAVSLAGPLRLFWTAVLGKGIRTSLQRDLDALAAVAETAPVA